MPSCISPVRTRAEPLTMRLGAGQTRGPARWPSALFRMHPRAIDRSGRIWSSRPSERKTLKPAKTKPIPILPELQHGVATYLLKASKELRFHAFHGSPCSHNACRNQTHKPVSTAHVDRWLPYSMRHFAAETVRERAALEAAKSLLGTYQQRCFRSPRCRVA